MEQLKRLPKGPAKQGRMGYVDSLPILVIGNTLQQTIIEWPDTYAILVRRYGVNVWGKDVAQAKTNCENLDYIWRLAVEIHNPSLPWLLEWQSSASQSS
ncbi:MAG: Methylthioribulose-1-phosphate dehydratase [Chrysothrix sp. TS-e1954]|nr:MAG: Methylthioribulose-1-phosphate dehydratase [Chrysothrix sp. TS-e1954]